MQTTSFISLGKIGLRKGRIQRQEIREVLKAKALTLMITSEVDTRINRANTKKG